MDQQSTPRLLLIATVALMFLFVIGTFVFNYTSSGVKVEIDSTNQPTLGSPKAKVQVVVFEEPKCPDCKLFNNVVVPMLKKEYIDTNKIRLSVIPVSFLSGSMLAAEALLCVYYQDANKPSSDLFFKYLDYLYRHQPKENTNWATTEKLLEFAQGASPDINLEQLKKCIASDAYRTQIMRNTQAGIRATNGSLSTPSIFVDGVRVHGITFEDLAPAIEEALKKGDSK